MEEWFDLIQSGMNAVRARQALVGTNRALNQSAAFLEELPDSLFTDADLRLIDHAYNNIPVWKRKIDWLDQQIDILIDSTDQQDVEAFVHDYKTIMAEIDVEMTALAKLIQHNRH
jgi:hypothetical protein